MNRGNILFVVTSHEVRTASPLGGEIPIDPESLRPRRYAGFAPETWLEQSKELLLESMPTGEVRHDEFDAIYYTGGYGSFWDLSVNRDNAALLELF